jgi:hypothetical protein
MCEYPQNVRKFPDGSQAIDCGTASPVTNHFERSKFDATDGYEPATGATVEDVTGTVVVAAVEDGATVVAGVVDGATVVVAAVVDGATVDAATVVAGANVVVGATVVAATVVVGANVVDGASASMANPLRVSTIRTAPADR